ncbi:hypothetical protein SAMN02745883_00700 [Caminicella sporogenes DSM 14501]|uniref:LSM domain-containing protein n=1 Tax=Caminicella sporogenes DSM 14501 TaxID=1121266 RepID=A0A1M6MY53_9FIRM|nr:hypothetical protein [Caminicella sporogenes]RKD22447.1 hypothetical protein BET04_05290 [Caminicella sporogenes]SHJ88397.1 hypothetical protein SAMN02745883_00700 [Caminicella sporogenes DSM 14501]
MKLWEYVGKKIKVTCIEGETIQGKCNGYTQELDNEPEIASITIDAGDIDYEIYENEIAKIEIVE